MLRADPHWFQCGSARNIGQRFCSIPNFLLEYLTVFRIRIQIHRIHMFLGLPDPDPLVRDMDPDPDPALDPDPDPSIIMQK
jgi:hypothetical protein